MRTYGRVYALNPDGSQQSPQPAGYPKWVQVTTDANGFNDDVYITTICQVFLLFLNESPFYSQYGLPAQQTVIQQVQPDFYMSRTQQQFAPFFASLLVAKDGNNPPAYNVNITKNNGAKVSLSVIPQ